MHRPEEKVGQSNNEGQIEGFLPWRGLSVSRKAQKNNNRSSKSGRDRSVANHSMARAQARNTALEAQRKWDAQDFESAIRLYRKAVRVAPNELRIMANLARCYGLRRRFREADQVVKRMLIQGKGSADVLSMAARIYKDIQRMERAAVYYRESLSIDGADLRTLIALARVAERLNRLDEVRELVGRALAIDNGSADVRVIQAKLHRRDEKLQDAESVLRNVVARNDAAVETLAEAWHEIGLVSDLQGDYAEAMAAFAKAHSLPRPGLQHAQRTSRLLFRMNTYVQEEMTADRIRRWRMAWNKIPNDRLAIICSHARSGTTLLSTLLDRHEEVISVDEVPVLGQEVVDGLKSAHPKGTPLFDVIDRSSQLEIASARQRYRANMEAALGDSIGNQMLVDKNPEATLYLPVVARVFPEMKVLVSLRDPRDVVLSCFMQFLDVNPVSASFATLTDAARKYVSTMKIWLSIRNMLPNSWMEVRYEELVADPMAMLRRICAFLDLPWSEETFDFNQRRELRPINAPNYAAVAQPLYSRAVGRWRNYESYFGEAEKILEPVTCELGYS